MYNSLFVLLQYSNSDLGLDEPSYWTFSILIIIGLIYYFIVYLPKKKEEEKENSQKLHKRKQSEAYHLSRISLGNETPFFPHREKGHFTKEGYLCPVCNSINDYPKIDYYLDHMGQCYQCGFRVDMIPKNTDGTYTIKIYNKDNKRELEKINISDFSLILSGKVIENFEQKE